MKNFFFTYSSKEDQAYLHLEQYPARWQLLVWSADALCALTRHHWCNKIVSPAYEAADRRTTHRLDYPVNKEHWQAWAAETGDEDPAYWWAEAN